MEPNAGGVQSSRKSNRVNGVLLLNKPAGMTSNEALQKVKRFIRADKGGHTGSLDPAATGMLPLCFGEATKVCAYLLESDKTYRVTAQLGEATDTGDADGKITETQPVPVLDYAAWQVVLREFVGNSDQIPPMYSALKINGKRLYELARQGKTIERKARKIYIRLMDLIEIRDARLVFRVHCSKGTYIRTLVEDIAKSVGTVAHTTKLHRESVGDFNADDMLDLESAELVAKEDPDRLRARLLSPDAALNKWPSCTLQKEDVIKFNRGQPVNPGCKDLGFVKVYTVKNKFLGVGESLGNGIVTPKRLFTLPD